jgi:ATP-dependent helicase/DNAse subunit B
LIKNSDFLALLKGKKSIYQEQPISYRGELYKIDLLIEDKSIDEVVIVDYKSSKKDIYSGIEQVLNYCSIVESITKKRATGYLCFLLKDRVEIKKVTI